MKSLVRPLLNGAGDLDCSTKYGTTFRIAFPRDRGWEYIFTIGDYESGTSQFCFELLRPGDIAIDVGANIGWFTTLFAKSVGSRGEVHAFEPMPSLFGQLHVNCNLSGVKEICVLNRVALGACNAEWWFESPKLGSHGETKHVEHPRFAEKASLANVIQLSEYLKGVDAARVKLLKIDVEGLEMDVLLGARAALDGLFRPSIVIEANFDAAREFGWSFDRLLRFLSGYSYRFQAVRKAWGIKVPIRTASDLRHGDNLLALPLDGPT